MTTSITASAMEQGNIGQQATGRPVVYGTQGVISSGHYLTSMAGMRMLLSGGNAFDAVVAAGFAAAVTEPIASYSLAAEGVFMLYHAESGDLLSLSGQGTAPDRATVDWYRSLGQSEIPTGPGPLAHLSFTVPGVVAAYLSLLERYGRKTVGEVLEPSIHYAERGIPNYEYMLERIDNPVTVSQFEQYPPGGLDIFYDDGKTPEPGSLLVQKGLGDIFRRLVEAEGAAGGHRADGVRAARDSFYTGEVAQIIAECSERVGGVLDMPSLAAYEAKYETPVKTGYMGYEVHGQQTWTQGAVLMQALNILENFDLRAMGHNSTAYIHTVSQAVNLAFADREAYYGDPDFVTVPIDGLALEGVRAGSGCADRSIQGYARVAGSGRPVEVLIPVRFGCGRQGASCCWRTETAGPTAVRRTSLPSTATATWFARRRPGGGFAKSVFFP